MIEYNFKIGVLSGRADSPLWVLEIRVFKQQSVARAYKSDTLGMLVCCLTLSAPMMCY